MVNLSIPNDMLKKISSNSNKKDTVAHTSTHVYAQINKELESLMPVDERIVFGPCEDFEYRAPLEDFKKTLQKTGGDK